MKNVEQAVIRRNRKDSLSGNIVRVSYKLFGGDRMTLDYGTDVQIHGAEIHIICYLKAHPATFISEIARDLNVTRGAISQLVAKLERKGLVMKETDPEDQKRKVVNLTEKGELAYEGHQKIHLMFDEQVQKIANEFDVEQMDAIMSFYDKLEEQVDKLILKIY